MIHSIRLTAIPSFFLSQVWHLVRARVGCLILACMLAIWCQPAQAASPGGTSVPSLNQGKKWRVAYVETEPYANYAGTLFYLLKGLEARGWVRGVEKIPFVWGQVDTREMWNVIRTRSDFSDYLEFADDGYYSLKSTPGKEAAVLQRFRQGSNVDLVIVMGTVAGKLMAVDDLHAKVMVFSTSNAFKSGIVKANDYSGRPHVWAHTDPQRYRQQLRVFFDIFRFKKLGVVYEDSPNGRTFAAIDDIEAVAREKGFSIVRKLVQGTRNGADQERYFHDLLLAHEALASQVDGFYLAVAPAPGLKPDHLYAALRPFYNKKIPVFSQLGDEEVKRGALISIARADFSGVGEFGAEQMARLLNGTQANFLGQTYSDTPAIALNMQVSREIGYRPSFDILLVSDKIFQTVDAPAVPLKRTP